MAKAVGGPMGGSVRAAKPILVIPSGVHRGKKLREVPLKALVLMLKWWSSDAAPDTQHRESMVNALSGEWERRTIRKREKEGRNKKKRRNRKLRRKLAIPADGRRRAILKVG